MTIRLDLRDIQGNIIRAYGRFGFPHARYFFLHIADPMAGRAFIDDGASFGGGAGQGDACTRRRRDQAYRTGAESDEVAGKEQGGRRSCACRPVRFHRTTCAVYAQSRRSADRRLFLSPHKIQRPCDLSHSLLPLFDYLLLHCNG